MYNSADFRLDGHVAVITGAGAGIGRAIAETGLLQWPAPALEP